MSRLSDSRISHLAQKILKTLTGEQLATVRSDRLVLTETKRVLAERFQVHDRIDAIVRRKIGSLSRPVPPGSREWDVLYRQYFEDELRKARRGGGR